MGKEPVFVKLRPPSVNQGWDGKKRLYPTVKEEREYEELKKKYGLR